MVFVLDAETLTLVDSVVLADTCIIYDLEATADGRRLFAHVLSQGGQYPFTAEVDVPSLTTTYQWAEWSLTDLVISNGEGTLVRESCGLELTDIESKASTSIPLTICDIEGISGGDLVGGLSYSFDTVIVYDVARRGISHMHSITTLSGEPVRVSSALPVSELGLLLIIGEARLTHTPYFLVASLSDGAMLFQHRIYGTQGTIAIDQDNSHAIVASHNDIRSGDSFGQLDVMSLSSLRHLKRFDASDFQSFAYPPDDIAFVPGTKLALIAVGLGSGGPIWELDYESLSVNRKDSTGRSWHGPIAVGPRY